MQLDAIVDFWKEQTCDAGRWSHPLDAQTLDTLVTSFNLDYPVSPYIGDMHNAPVVILNANAGYDAIMTPAEFPSQGAIERYLDQVRNPSSCAWTAVSPYYLSRNYGRLIQSRKAVVVNASPYRSTKISAEKANRAAIEALPSTKFHRQWLREALLPAAGKGLRLVIAHRWGLWKLSHEMRNNPGLRLDHRCRAFPDIDSLLLQEAQDFTGQGAVD
jgi:hypothetical protein